MGQGSSLEPQVEIGGKPGGQEWRSQLGLEAQVGRGSGPKVVLSLGWILEPSVKLSVYCCLGTPRNTDSTGLGCRVALGPNTPQEISTRSQESQRWQEGDHTAGGCAGSSEDRGWCWGQGPSHRRSDPWPPPEADAVYFQP